MKLWIPLVMFCASLPAQTLKDFVVWAKANPGRVSYGHSGVGSLPHLIGELFKSLTGLTKIVQVPYRGCRSAEIIQ